MSLYEVVNLLFAWHDVNFLQVVLLYRLPALPIILSFVLGEVFR